MRCITISGAGSSGSYDLPEAGHLSLDSESGTSPCSGQGLPPINVTIDSCGLLPRSFHPFPRSSASEERRWFGFCGTFPGLHMRQIISSLYPVAVSNCPSLCCPDFPPSRLADSRAASRLTGRPYYTINVKELRNLRISNTYFNLFVQKRVHTQYFRVNYWDLFFSASRVSLTSASASLLCSLGTCVYVTFLKWPARSLIASCIGQRSRFLILYLPFS